MKRILVLHAAVSLFLTVISCSAAFAVGIDWNGVKGQKMFLFYPGVASWEFLTGDDHRLGGREIKKGRKGCRQCHMGADGDLDLRTDEIAAGTARMKRSGNPLEPEPNQVKGASGLLRADVKAAYDAEFLYVRVEWESKGASWRAKKDAHAPPDRVSIQMNKTEPSFRKYGCFIACHNDLSSMPEGPVEKEGSSRRLYAFYARDSWAMKKSGAELDKRLKEGGRIELLSAELSGAQASARSGWVFDDRVWDAAPDIEAEGAWNNGRYSVVFKKRLTPKDPLDAALRPGTAVSAGIAVHDGGGSKRRHYVSFPFTIGLDSDADVMAARVSQ